MNILEHLKSPELVVKVQEYFGIEYVKKYTVQNQNHHITANNHHNKLERNNILRRNSNLSTELLTATDSKFQEKSASAEYLIRNNFWYYLFLIGTELGDELFYGSFIPFWFWNVDGAVGRRVIFVWSMIFYIGQSSKDVIRWPRPGPPVARLQKKWGLEYGMPSTHAMVAVSLPFSVLIFTQYRYLFPVYIGLSIAIVWSFIVCMSRLYLGMHSVLDVVAGILLTVVLMVVFVPLVDFLDIYILTHPISPFVVLFISIMLIVYYPRSDKWTPTRGDTTMTVSVLAGLQIGGWINYQLGDMIPSVTPPPYEVNWPTYQMLGLLLVRTVFGLSCILATRFIGKPISYAFACALLGRDKNEIRNSENSLENKDKIFVELCYKFFTYGMIGFNTQFVLPYVFKFLNIGRPDFFTEL